VCFYRKTGRGVLDNNMVQKNREVEKKVNNRRFVRISGVKRRPKHMVNNMNGPNTHLVRGKIPYFIVK